MKFTIKDTKDSKKLLYREVYDKLYKKIISGEYEINSKLPSEPDLAKSLGVSRMTLRQALALLQDDGLVKNLRGKGNFITSPKKSPKKDFLELIGNPIYKCHTEKIEDIDLEFRLELPSDYTKEVLEKDSTAVLACERYYKRGDKILAYAFTFMDVEKAKKFNLDLHKEEELLKFLEEDSYNLSSTSLLEIKHSLAGNSLNPKYKLVGGNKCDLILESLYEKDCEEPILFNKYYIPSQYSTFKISARKKE